jgi:hypothetical protein
MKDKYRAIRVFVLINLAAWLAALIPAEGLRDWTTLLVWSAFWLVIVVPFSLGVALNSDYQREQWGILRSKQSVLVNRHLADWSDPDRGPGPGRDEPDFESAETED